MANTNPGGIDLNTSPYFDDYDEDKEVCKDSLSSWTCCSG